MKKTDFPRLVLEELLVLKDHFKSIQGVNLIEGQNGIIFSINDPYGGDIFFYKIHNARFRDKDHGVWYEIELCPPTQYNLEPSKNDGYNIENTIRAFDSWIENVKFISTADIFKDPILEDYEYKFYQDLELADEDAEYTSFSIHQQIAIDKYLEKSIKLLENKISSNEVSDKNIEKVQEVICELKDLQETQTELTKNQVVKKISNIWAKCQKIGLKFVKDVYSEALKESIKQGIKFISENSESISDGLTNIIS